MTYLKIFFHCDEFSTVNTSLQGCLITRFRDSYDTRFMNQSSSHDWYIVQTNYDPWNSPPFYDDRRTPAQKCLADAYPNRDVFPSALRNTLQSVGDSVSSLAQSAWRLVKGNEQIPTTVMEKHSFADNNNGSLSVLYNVFSTRPVLNKLTTYTTLMCAEDGYIQTHLRWCGNPCWPW